MNHVNLLQNITRLALTSQGLDTDRLELVNDDLVPIQPGAAVELDATSDAVVAMTAQLWTTLESTATSLRDMGMVLEPANFDAVVEPGGNIQTAIDRCRAGGSLLIRPGTYAIKTGLLITRELHVFGRGLVTLRVKKRDGITVRAAEATLDGLTVSRDRAAAGPAGNDVIGVLFRDFGVRARMQHCVVTGDFHHGVCMTGGCNAVVASCRIHDVRDVGIVISGVNTFGTVINCDVGSGAGSSHCLYVLHKARPNVLFNRFRGGGVTVSDAHASLSGNDFAHHRDVAVVIKDGADVVMTANRVRDGLSGISIFGEGSKARLERNEVWNHGHSGVDIFDGAGAHLFGNVIRDNRRVGVVVSNSKRVYITRNAVFNNARANVGIRSGAAPRVCHNFIHGAVTDPAHPRSTMGVFFEGSGTRGRLEDNDVFDNDLDVSVENGADPLIVRNRIHDAEYGVEFVNSSGGTLRNNNVWGHRSGEVYIWESSPLVENNRIHDGRGVGIKVFGPASTGVIRNNDVRAFPTGVCVRFQNSGACQLVGNRIRGGGNEENRGDGVGVYIEGGSRCHVITNDVCEHARACIMCVNSSPLISGNALSAGGEGGVVLEFDVDGMGEKCRVEGNAVFNNPTDGMAVFGGSPESLELQGNVFCGNAGAGAWFNGQGADAALIGAGNAFSHNSSGDVVVVNSPPPDCDRALCSSCGAVGGSALKRCNGCARFGIPFSPRYCGPACQRGHWPAHKPDCQRAEARADEWLHALDALLALPGDPYGGLELLAQRRLQRELVAADEAIKAKAKAGSEAGG